MLGGGIGGAEEQRKFRDRVEWARGVVFGDERRPRPILLSEDILDKFSLGKSASTALNERKRWRRQIFRARHEGQRTRNGYLQITCTDLI